MHRLFWKPAFLLLLSAILVSPAQALPEKAAKQRIETLSARVESLEEQLAERPAAPDWIEYVVISGLLEAEAAYQKNEPVAAGETDEEAGDIVLSTMELGVDTAFNNYTSGHVLFLWEEDETAGVDVDEGFITLSGGNTIPGYIQAGKFYVPFGYFESAFISDPLTLELGETNESAVLAGCSAGGFDFSAGVFNGDVDAAGDHDHIDDYFGSAALSLPENQFAGIKTSAGISYISNIGDSDFLSEEIDSDGINDEVAGFSGYLHGMLAERIFFLVEYMGALDGFAPGELAAQKMRPRAWITELAYMFESKCGFGIKYEGSEEAGQLLPETRCGAVAFCHPLPGTFLGVEYLLEAFENDDENEMVTVQLAYEF